MSDFLTLKQAEKLQVGESFTMVVTNIVPKGLETYTGDLGPFLILEVKIEGEEVELTTESPIHYGEEPLNFFLGKEVQVLVGWTNRRAKRVRSKIKRRQRLSSQETEKTA